MVYCHFMPCAGYHPNIFTIPGPGKEPGSFNYRSLDSLHMNAFSQWTKLKYGSQGVPGSPSFMWEHDSVHQFFGPGILDIDSLLIFQSLASQRPENEYRNFNLKFLREVWTDGDCTQFIRY
jgi:hypothetical protein